MTAPFSAMTPNEAAGFMATKERQRIRDVIASRVYGKTVLDVGCGRAIGIESMCPDPSKYLGLDCSRALIDVARAAHPGYVFWCCDVRKMASTGFQNYDFAVVVSVLEHQETLADAVAIYNFALSNADRVLVGWHTPPVYSATEIIAVKACDLNEPLYQNHYQRGSFASKDVQVEVERVDEFTLWTATRGH